MKDKGIYHNVRCSMHNKQHVYVHKVLTDLNLSIYKSKNQFIIDAVEHYAKSLNQEDLTNTAAEQYIRAGQTKEGPDTEALKKEIVNEVTVAVQTNVISVLMTELAKIKEPDAEGVRKNTLSSLESSLNSRPGAVVTVPRDICIPSSYIAE